MSCPVQILKNAGEENMSEPENHSEIGSGGHQNGFSFSN